MANQAEVIDLRYEAGGATADAVRSANSIGEAYEKSADRAGAAMERAADSHGSSILRVIDRSKLSTDRYLASLERRVQGIKSPLDQLTGQRTDALARYGGDPKAVDAINQKFATLISYQKQIDIDQRLNKAAEASRRAAKDADTFQAALVRVNQQQKQAAAQAVAARASVVADFARQATSPADRLIQERAAALEKVKGDPAAVAAVTASISKLTAAEKEAAESAKALSLGEKIKHGLEDPIGAGGAAISGLASKIGAVGIIATAAFVGIGLAAKEAFDFVAEAGEKAKGIANLADILGTTDDEAQRLDAMAKIASVDIQGLTGFMRGLAKALTEGGEEGKKNAQALSDLGIHARDSQGNLKGTIQLLTEIAHSGEKLDTREYEAKLTALGARGAIALIPLLKHFDEVDAAAKEAGAGLQGNVIKQLEEADDKVKQLSVKWDLLKQAFAAKIAPVIIPIAVNFTTNLKKGFHFDPFNAIDPLGVILGGAADAAKKETRSEVTVEQKTSFTADQRRSQELQAQFRARNTLDGLKTQIEAKESELKAEEAKFDKGQFGPDADSSVVAASIKKIATLRAEDDALKLNLKTLQELPGLQKQAKEAALEAQAAELTGISKIIAERDKQIHQLSTVTDNGKTSTINLAEVAPGILADVEATTQAKIRAEQSKTAAELLTLNAKTGALILENYRANLRAEEELADGHLALLESKELLSRREVENERLRIHKQAIDSIAALDKKQLEDAAALEIRQLREHQGRSPDSRDKSADFARIIAVRQQLALKTGQIDKATADAQAKADEDLENQRILRNRQFADQSVSLQAQNLDREASLQENALGHRRDLELDSLALVDQQTLSSKLGVEQKRLEIETQFLKQSEDLQLASADRRLNTELALLDVQARREGVSDEERIRRRELLEQQFADDRLGIERDTEAAITSAALKEAATRADAIREHNRTIFDDFKRESEGVFDDMERNGENLFQALGHSLKNAFLTAIKDIVTSRVAAGLTQLVTGQKVTLVQENQGAGPLGKILTALGVGAKPTFGTPPTFKTKLDDPNHIGDVLLNGGAVPVFVKNQIAKEQASARSLPFLPAGATAALAVALGLGTLGSVAKAAPTPVGIVQSTFSAGEDVSAGPGRVFGETDPKILSALENLKPAAQQKIELKLDQPNHLGDVNLQSGSVPVIVKNQQESQQKSGLSSLPFGLGAVAGLGALLGFGGKSAATPAGIVQSTIDFGGGSSSTGPGQIFGTGSILGGPGGTPGFAGPVNFGSQSSAAGQGGIFGSLKGSLSGFKGILQNLGGIGMDKGGLPGVGDQPGTDLGAGAFGGHGIGGATGGALLAGGGVLAVDGLRRGGVSGLLETTAGGALIGAKFGGPVGALIGAGVGAIAGTIRLFIKSGAEKVVSKVKAIYGIDIDKKFAQDPILGIIKQNFGGNVDVGLRSPQIRDLLELYATTTDQKSAGIVNRVQQSTFANQGGSLVNIPNLGLTGAPVGFSAGSAIGNGITFGLGTGNGPQFAPAAPAAPVPQNISVSVKLDGDSTKQFVQGQQVDAIKANPRAVSTANNDGLMTSAARRSTAASVLQPNFITG